MAFDVSTFTVNIGLRNLKREETVSQLYQDIFKKTREIPTKIYLPFILSKNLLQVGDIDPIALCKMISFFRRKPGNLDRGVVQSFN